MTVTETRSAQTTRAIPRPRTPADDVRDEAARDEQPAATPEPAPPTPRYPWPEPWGNARGARPRSEFWDVTTASWRSSGPYPQQRKG